MTDQEISRLQVDTVSKRYVEDNTTTRALADVSLTVSPSEFVCIVGPSGCGKTTLFRILAGLESPTGGDVFLDEARVTEPTPDMGIVFQEYHLFPWRTVRENIRFGLERTEQSAAEQQSRVDQLLALVGLEGAGDQYPKSISGGMKQRVALARALAVDPGILLMDEPFSAVDAQTRAMLQDELLRIWQRTGKTVLFVTHDIEEAITLADRIVVMTDGPGRIAEHLSVDLERPRDRTEVAFQEYYERILDLIHD